jgi:hypothetical protein
MTTKYILVDGNVAALLDPGADAESEPGLRVQANAIGYVATRYDNARFGASPTEAIRDLIRAELEQGKSTP